MADSLVFIGDPVVVDANTASTRRALPKTPRLLLTIPANGCWFKMGTIDVVAAAGAAGVVAAATLTSTGVIQNNETAVIAGRTYTFKTALTGGGATANEVLIGADQTASHLNLLRAVNAGAGSGTLYGSATVIHPTVTAISSNGTTTVFNAKVAGTAGNAFGSTETCANASFGGATFASGADPTETSMYLPPAITLVIDNPMANQAAQLYIAAIKNTTAALLYVQGVG